VRFDCGAGIRMLDRRKEEMAALGVLQDTLTFV
jgi:hypothetical protein